jgi:hypothetical protein
MQSEQSTKNSHPIGSDAYKAFRLERNLLKYGPAYSSWIFNALAPETQDFFRARRDFDSGEQLVYAYFENDGIWILVTSRRVMWSKQGHNHQLRFSEIAKMGLSEIGMIQTNDREKRSKELERIKVLSPHFYFEDWNGDRFEALLPPGGPLSAVWNTLLFMIQLEKIHPTQSNGEHGQLK